MYLMLFITIIIGKTLGASTFLRYRRGKYFAWRIHHRRVFNVTKACLRKLIYDIMVYNRGRNDLKQKDLRLESEVEQLEAILTTKAQLEN